MTYHQLMNIVFSWSIYIWWYISMPPSQIYMIYPRVPRATSFIIAPLGPKKEFEQAENWCQICSIQPEHALLFETYPLSLSLWFFAFFTRSFVRGSRTRLACGIGASYTRFSWALGPEREHLRRASFSAAIATNLELYSGCSNQMPCTWGPRQHVCPAGQHVSRDLRTIRLVRILYVIYPASLYMTVGHFYMAWILITILKITLRNKG